MFRLPGLFLSKPRKEVLRAFQQNLVNPQEEVNPRRMFDAQAETLTYEPISFLVQRSTINPDSPRHFINGRNNINNDTNNNNNNDNKKNSINIITKRQSVFLRKKYRNRQSMLDFLPSTITKKRDSRRSDRDHRKSADAMVDLWVGSSSHKLHSPRLVRSQTIEGLGLEGRSYSKPITSRLKVREKRRLTLDNKNEVRSHTSNLPLTRSKSDAGTYDWSKELSREEIQKKCRALLKARLCVMDTSSCDSFSEADSCLDSSASSFYELFPNDKRYRQYSSSPSSGFGTESEENEALSFSRSSSVFIPITKTMPLRPKSAEITSFKYDKDAETKMYSKSLEKSRRPSSIVRSQSFGKQCENKNADKGNIVINVDDAFGTDSDSEIDDVKYKENNEKRKPLSPKIAAIVRERKLRQKLTRQVCYKPSINVDDGIESEDATSLKDVTNIADTKRSDLPTTDLGNTAGIVFNDVQAICDINSVTSPMEVTKGDGKISLEQYVYKLSRTPVSNSNGQEAEKCSVLTAVKNIRIESVL